MKNLETNNTLTEIPEIGELYTDTFCISNRLATEIPEGVGELDKERFSISNGNSFGVVEEKKSWFQKVRECMGNNSTDIGIFLWFFTVISFLIYGIIK